MITFINQYMDAILNFANIIILAYAAYRFSRKPQDSLEERVKSLERRLDKAESRMDKIEDTSEKHTDDIGRSISAITALVDFELAYCINTHYEEDGISDLMHAKKVLRGED